MLTLLRKGRRRQSGPMRSKRTRFPTAGAFGRMSSAGFSARAVRQASHVTKRLPATDTSRQAASIKGLK